MTILTNFPTPTNTDSSNSVKTFFDNYYIKQYSYPADQINAVIGFFQKNGFDEVSSIAIATVLLQQAKIDNINVFDLLNTLKGLDEIKLSALVAEILNYNRQRISALGYKTTDVGEYLETRNIVV